MNAVELKIEGMTCGSCVARVRNALMRVDGVAGVYVDLAGGRATVRASDEDLSADELVAALAAVGYPASSAAGSPARPGADSGGNADRHGAAARPAGQRSGCCCGS